MKITRKTILLVAMLGITACTSPGRFGAGGAGVDPAGIGSASDPASPAYFQEAVGDRVLFLVNQHTLNEQSRAILQGQATWLLNNSDYAAVIEGHADEQGTSAYNVALSARRANSVIEFLVERGVASTRLKALPLGKARPIAICSDESCYSQNRRSVTVLQASGLS